MDTNLIEHLKEYLSNNDIDGLLLNTTNDYMVEYNTQDLNSVYYTTDFTGSTGYVLFTKDKTFLFVDTRYHEQADNQVDKEFVEVQQDLAVDISENDVASDYEYFRITITPNQVDEEDVVCTLLNKTAYTNQISVSFNN